VRYLSLGFALGALRRGVSIEQFLGPVIVDGCQGIRWATLEPTGDEVTIREHMALDIPGFESGDLDNLPPMYEGDDLSWGWIVGTAPTANAVTLAHELLGAPTERWVNVGVAGEDYLAWVRSGRPTGRA
jgi:hypothetical protein